tara:strand:- start:81 stop:230 length:150 start_codon:yes stop_codon:yes gene_type:complete
MGHDVLIKIAEFYSIEQAAFFWESGLFFLVACGSELSFAALFSLENRSA